MGFSKMSFHSFAAVEGDPTFEGIAPDRDGDDNLITGWNDNAIIIDKN